VTVTFLCRSVQILMIPRMKWWSEPASVPVLLRTCSSDFLQFLLMQIWSTWF
jgi:hypothetical protein